MLRNFLVCCVAFLILGACTPEKPVLIVCFGDSLTAGFLVKPEESYPAHLSKLVNLKVINAGSTGDTSFSAQSRVVKILLENPTHVILELGANDFLLGIFPDECRKNLSGIIKSFQSKGISVVLLDFSNEQMIETSSVANNTRLRSYKSMYKALADEYHLVLIDDIWAGVLGNPALMVDSFHPNGDGYKIMAQTIAKTLKSPQKILFLQP